MPPDVTLMSLCSDVRLLVKIVPGVDLIFVQTLDENENEALLGSVAPVDEEMIHVGLLELRAAWEEPDRFPPHRRSYPGILERDRRLAFCLGGLVQLASGLATDRSEPASFQQDAIVLTKAILADEQDEFETFLWENHGGKDGLQEAFADFVLALFLRSMAEAHTMIPDMVHILGWMDSLIYGAPQLERQIAGFAQAVYPNGAAGIRQQHGSDLAGFYDAADPAIRAAEAARKNRAPNLDRATFDATGNRSVYGKALCRCVAAVVRVSQAWREGTLTGRISEVWQ